MRTGSVEAWERRLEGWGLEMARSGRGRLGSRGLARRAGPSLCRRRRVVFPLPRPQGQAVAALSAREDERPLPPHPPVQRSQHGALAAARGRVRRLPAQVLVLVPASALVLFCLRGRRPDSLRHEASRLRAERGTIPFPLRVKQGFGGWSPGMVRFKSGWGRPTKTNTSEHFLFFLGPECLIDRCYVLAGRKFYFSLVSRFDLEKDSHLALF